MSKEQFVMMLQEAGKNMTNEQIGAIGKQAEQLFGINKDELMLLLISGKEDFKEMIFNQASKKIRA
ncbi:hypothetical protein [Clostridium beijerinckii]|uniref:hypothetical protein n=1 Tax=Clostridium beijerinckii TaxID=1520 RepID=UPI001570D208|nr:hypothetical protein [Clostridium beijerinckii]NRU52489.1 23S rRNA pseudoU1915 N3-methylase RlmH [Clostridium beijerinckii]NYC69066.1 23S rRNA pseudoU1915 N3-methylase RlmH [Clostridium beijerinckii]NYC91690.1 23S rRNA pseudoU1915 N3-methylase RlmH [Clostridium beijerinckii]